MSQLRAQRMESPAVIELFHSSSTINRYKNFMTALLILSTLVGLGVGIWLKNIRQWTNRQIMYIHFPCEIFIGVLQMVSTLLSITAVITSFVKMQVRFMRSLLLWAMAYYLITTSMAASLGLIMVSIISPTITDDVSTTLPSREMNPDKAIIWIIHTLRSLFVSNIVNAHMEQTEILISLEENNMTIINSTIDADFHINHAEGHANLLGLFVFSIFLGAALKERIDIGRSALMIFSIAGQLFLKLVEYMLWISPIAFFFKTVTLILYHRKLLKEFETLRMFIMTLVLSLSIHALIIIPLMFYVVVRRNPYRFIFEISRALLFGLLTSSSGHTIPITLICLNEYGVEHNISSLLIPLGTTISRSGSAIYTAISVFFLLYILDNNINTKTITFLWFATVFMSPGSSTFGKRNVKLTAVIMQVAGANNNIVSLVESINWMADRLVTMVNILTNAFLAAILAHIRIKELSRPSSLPYFPKRSFH